MTTSQYRYVKIGRAYLCLQQNPMILAWFLCLMNKSLGLGLLGLTRRKAARLVKSFAWRWLRPQSRASALELPVYGNLCLQVHRGYRVFDFHRVSVSRVFSSEVDAASVAAEIKRARDASLLDFAPTIRRWNTQQRWYEEDYVIGRPGSSLAQSVASELLRTYCQDIEPCITSMILLQPPLRIDLSEYISKLTYIIYNSKAFKSKLDHSKISTIRQFVEMTARQLRREENRQIDLVFSHGDFSLVNIVNSRHGIKVIDWESADHRSVLSDLYNYFFTEVYYKRATIDIASELNQAIASLQSRLALEAPELARTLPSLEQIYRNLYYIERVCTLLERELNDQRLDVILSSIDVFSRYQEAQRVSNL